MLKEYNEELKEGGFLMSRKFTFGLILSTIFTLIIVLTLNACAQREVKQEEAVVETPAPKTEEAPATETAQPPAQAAAKETPSAPEPAPITTPTPAPATATAGASVEQIKNIDPSLLIYLSSRGVLAGTGDPSGLAGEAEKIGMAEHPAAMELAKLPKDKYGLVDWAASIKTGRVKPLDSLEAGAVAAPPFNLDIVIHTKSNFMNDVVFPHYVHTLWLTCTNCHTKIFQMKAGGNTEMTMPKIASGEYCGRCHNRVAFPLTDCSRCHVKPKETASPARQK